ncbi:MAG: hypothetical protein AAF383_28290 [Cyanobacteria bacterium P01_A01_bin.83]
MLKTTYLAFLICNLVFFSIEICGYFVILFFAELLPVFLFFPKLALSVCNLIGGKNNRFNTSSGDTVILIMCFISLLPFVKFITSIVGLVFCIINLGKYNKWKKHRKKVQEASHMFIEIE